MTAQKNADGLLVRFGSDQGRRGTNGRVGVARTSGKTDELVLEVDLAGVARTIFPTDTDGDGTRDGFAVGLDTPIPAGSLIKEVVTIVETTATGGTSFQLGTYTSAAVADDDDGLLAAGTTTAAGAAGAQVGTVLTADRYLAVKTIGTYTAGRVKFFVRIVRP